MNNTWRYTVLTVNKHGDPIEVAKFRTGDCTELFLDALKEEFRGRYPDFETEIEDAHAPLTFVKLMEGESV